MSSPPPTCIDCSHRPAPGARFCDQCGARIAPAPDKTTKDEPLSLHMSTLLLESDFDAVFARMQHGKRTAKSLAALFRSWAAQEQSQAMEMKKSVAALTWHEPESRSVSEFLTQLAASLDRQGRLSTMFSSCVVDEVVDPLNQLRFQLKQHHRAAVDRHARALKTLAAAESTIQKCRDRIARILSPPTTGSGLMSAARGMSSQSLSLPAAHADLAKALVARDANQAALTAIRTAILDEWEGLEQWRLAQVVNALARVLTLAGSVFGHKVAINSDLLCKLRSVSVHDDIRAWLQQRAPATVRDPSPIPAPDPEPQSPSMRHIFDWAPAPSWEPLSPSSPDAKLIAICVCCRLADPDRQRYYRRDLRVLLGIRESLLDSALATLDRSIDDAVRDPALDPDHRRLLCRIIAAQVLDQPSLLALHQIDVDGAAPAQLDIGAFDIGGPFTSPFVLMLYRALCTAMIEDAIASQPGDGAESSVALPTVTDDWIEIGAQLALFRERYAITDANQAAAWLHCLRWDVLGRLPQPRPDRKVDLTAATVSAIREAVRACVAMSEPTAYLAVVVTDFKEWVQNAGSLRYFCLAPSTMIAIRDLFFLFAHDAGRWRESVLDAANAFYGCIRDQAEGLNRELVGVVCDQLDWFRSVPHDASLDADLDALRSQVRAQIWDDALKAMGASPATWVTVLTLLHVDPDADAANGVAQDQLRLWLMEMGARIPAQIDKMLLADNRAPIGPATPFSSSVVDLFSALNAVVDTLERWQAALGVMQIQIGDNVAADLRQFVSSSIRAYADALQSGSRAPRSQIEAKAVLRQTQADSDAVIGQAMSRFNTKATLLHLTRSVKKIATKRSGGDDAAHAPPNHAAIAMPVATSLRPVPELIAVLNNCRQAIVQSELITARIATIFGSDCERRCALLQGRRPPDLAVAVPDHLETACAELAQLVADRLVFGDLQAQWAAVYHPSPSTTNSVSDVVLKPMDDAMAAIFTALHDDVFKSRPMFQTVVTDVFGSVLVAFLWIISDGAGDRVFHDVNYSLLNDDLHAIENLFYSELPGDAAARAMEPVAAHLELMALSSNEIVAEVARGTLAKSSAAAVLARRNDAVTVPWLKAQHKFAHKFA